MPSPAQNERKMKMASIEKRGDSYRIKVSCGYDVNGKKIVSSITYHPEYFTSTGKAKAASVIQKELEQFVAEFERSVRLGDTLAGSSMRVADLIERYLKEYAFVELSVATAEGYETALKKKILPKFGHYKVSDLCRRQLEIQAFYNDMAKPDDEGKCLAQSTVKRNMNVFSSMMNWAVNMSLAPSNPLRNVKPPREKYSGRKVKSFSVEELNRFIQALDMPITAKYKAHTRTKKNGVTYDVPEYTETRYIPEQYKLFYILAVFSGCRRCELLALDWSDIDFEACTIRIYKSLSKIKGALIIKETKTTSGVRTINIPVSVIELARKWKIHQQEWRLQMGTAWKGEDNVFSQVDGPRIYPDSVTARFKEVLRNYNASCAPADKLPEITLHGLRHTSASILINQHTDIATVSKRLGHSRTSVTLDIYTHAIAEADKEAAAALDTIARSAGV